MLIGVFSIEHCKQRKKRESIRNSSIRSISSKHLLYRLFVLFQWVVIVHVQVLDLILVLDRCHRVHRKWTLSKTISSILISFYFQWSGRGIQSSSWDGESGYRVHVSDFAAGVSRKEVERVFGKYGPINEVWVATNPPCFAFINFKHRSDADKAIREVDGKYVEITDGIHCMTFYWLELLVRLVLEQVGHVLVHSVVAIVEVVVILTVPIEVAAAVVVVVVDRGKRKNTRFSRFCFFD